MISCDGYTLSMAYNRMSSPTHKTLTVLGSNVLQSQNFDYLYEDNSKPNAVTRIGDNIYHYDASGNVTYIERDTTWRELVWDEENRLTKLSDAGYTSRYTYDHAGNRTMKSSGYVTEVGINGAPQGIIYHDEDHYTMYPSAYLTVEKDRYTKHYYAGTKRICSSIGTGEFENTYGVGGFYLSAGGKDYGEKMKQIEQARRLEILKRGTPPGLPTQKGKTAEPEYSGIGYPELVLGDYSVPEGWPTPPQQSPVGGPAGPAVHWEAPQNFDDVPAGTGFVSDGMEEIDQFYFHSDHLGSTSYLTDHDGNISQFVCYTPYGETLVDEHLTGVDPVLHNGTYRTRYLFNGKELDTETNLYYYGARYFEPKEILWYGCDPLREKYPFTSSYVFCNANPVKYVDPDGKEFDEANEVVAQEIESQIDSKLSELQRIENPSDDTRERINELQQSKQDIADMRKKEGVFFSFKNSSDDSNPAGTGNPTIDGVGTDHVTMYVDDNMGSKLHESRHGGDVARGTLTNDNYGVHHEVSAYRAQYSWNGSFSYIPFTDFDDKSNLYLLAFKGINTFRKSITDIKEITPDLVKSLVDCPGLNQKFIYPQFR